MIRKLIKSMTNAKMLLAVITMLSCLSVSAQHLTEAQQKAQKSLMNYLQDKGYAPSIDTEDQSVCFKLHNELYWVNISGNTSPLLYTLNRKGLKLSGTDAEIARKREDAQIATNVVNAKSMCKTYVTGDQVVFCFPMLAETPEAFQRCLGQALKSLSTVRDDFMSAYKDAGKVTQQRHEYWYNLDTATVIIPQPNITFDGSPAPVQSLLNISNYALRVVGANNNEITGWNQGIRRHDCQFIQPAIKVSAKDKGTYKIGIRIFTPDNKLMLPSNDAMYTTVSTFTIDKKDKDTEVQLNKFGSTDNRIWVPGEYRIEFWEGDHLLKESSFNIL